jgi:hypothetical protein
MSRRSDESDRRVTGLLVERLVELVESWQEHFPEHRSRWGDPPALRAARAWLAADAPPGIIGPDVAEPLLEATMSAISEKYSAAGWLTGLEFLLWRRVTGDHRRPPADLDSLIFDDLDDAERRALREFSDAAGGWFREYRQFVPLPAWLTEYEREMTRG